MSKFITFVKNFPKKYIFLIFLILTLIYLRDMIPYAYFTMLMRRIHNIPGLFTTVILPVFTSLIISILIPIRIININKLLYIFLILPIFSVTLLGIPAIILDILPHSGDGMFSTFIELYLIQAIYVVGGVAICIGLIHVLLLNLLLKK